MTAVRQIKHQVQEEREMLETARRQMRERLGMLERGVLGALSPEDDQGAWRIDLAQDGGVAVVPNPGVVIIGDI